MIYLDYAATSPMRREAVEAYVEAASQAFGNTQSLHDHGTKAAEYIRSCKGVFGELISTFAPLNFGSSKRFGTLFASPVTGFMLNFSVTPSIST